MAALVTVHNEGPDAVEVRLGKHSLLLYAGQDYRVSTGTAVALAPLPHISAEELALHMGGRRNATEKYRSVEEG